MQLNACASCVFFVLNVVNTVRRLKYFRFTLAKQRSFTPSGVDRSLYVECKPESTEIRAPLPKKGPLPHTRFDLQVLNDQYGGERRIFMHKRAVFHTFFEGQIRRR